MRMNPLLQRHLLPGEPAGNNVRRVSLHKLSHKCQKYSILTKYSIFGDEADGSAKILGKYSTTFLVFHPEKPRLTTSNRLISPAKRLFRKFCPEFLFTLIEIVWASYVFEGLIGKRSRSMYHLQTQRGNLPEGQLEDTVSIPSEPFCRVSLLLYFNLQPSSAFANDFFFPPTLYFVNVVVVVVV